MKILALDQSSNITGWAIFDGTKQIDYGIYQPEGELMSRLSQLKEWVEQKIWNIKPDLVGIEEIVNSKGSEYYTTFKVLAYVQGIIELVCYEQGVKCEVVNASSWKHHVGIKGKSRKEQKAGATAAVKRIFGINFGNHEDDRADALLIGKYLADSRNSAF